MKADIHPKYNYVVFNDLASGEKFLTRSTVGSSKTITWEDGNEYPVIDVEISAASHPFYTGKQRIMDTAGRVERFNARFKASAARSSCNAHTASTTRQPRFISGTARRGI